MPSTPIEPRYLYYHLKQHHDYSLNFRRGGCIFCSQKYPNISYGSFEEVCCAEGSRSDAKLIRVIPDSKGNFPDKIIIQMAHMIAGPKQANVSNAFISTRANIYLST